MRGVKKNWRLVVTPTDGGKPSTTVKSEQPSDDEVRAIHNRGAAVRLVYVSPLNGKHFTVTDLPGLGEAPEGMKRCRTCGTAAKVDEFGRFVDHGVGSYGEPCEHVESPDEHGPFVIALPDFRPGDKVARIDTDFADLSAEDADLAAGTVIDVTPTAVRVSWPTGGYELESPHELRTLNVAYVHDGSRAEPVRVHIPEVSRDPICSVAPPLDHASMMAMHRPEGIPDVTGGYDGDRAWFAGSLDERDHRITVSAPDGRVLAVTRDAECRLGNIAARVLDDAGYAVTGLIASESTPGDPVYAVGPRRRQAEKSE